MTALEYLNKITDGGLKCRLTQGMVNQHTTEKATEVNDMGNPISKWTVVCYKAESISEGKRDERILEKITLTALNTRSDKASVRRFHDAVMKIIPKDFRNGDYDYAQWLDFLTTFVNYGIGNTLLNMTMQERHLVGGRAMWAMLTKRVEAWNERIEAKIENEGSDKVVHINLGSF